MIVTANVSIHGNLMYWTLLRYSIVKSRLEKLGYIVSGAEYNTADFGLPQQRRRAWLLCIQASELSSSSAQLAADMNLFRRHNVSLSSCMDLTITNTEKSSRASNKVATKEPKWKGGFEAQCEIYGKAHGVFLLFCVQEGSPVF